MHQNNLLLQMPTLSSNKAVRLVVKEVYIPGYSPHFELYHCKHSSLL